MIIELTSQHFKELIKKSYSLDMLFLLKIVNEGFDVKSVCKDSVKITAIYNSLLRKGLINSEEKLTVTGKDLLEFIDNKEAETFIKKKPESSEFEKWWTIYPATDAFIINKKHFSGTRGLRVNKEKCLIAFNKIIEENQYTFEEILSSTIFDITQRKNNSLKVGTNQLTFIPNSLTYLNQKQFEPFIELCKTSLQQTTMNLGSTDI